jgi:hypothetical protein
MTASAGYHLRMANDPSRPLVERASHGRSAARQIGRSLDVSRSVVIERIGQISGVDLNAIASEDALARAMSALSAIKENGLAPESPNLGAAHVTLTDAD